MDSFSFCWKLSISCHRAEIWDIGKMQEKICSLILPNRQLPSLCCGCNIVWPSHQVRKETTSTELFLVTCLKWLGIHRVAQTPLSDGRGFHNPTPSRLVLEPWL
jgi:hypothetical protein